MSEVVNAQIKATSLGVDDGPCFSCWLYLEWPGAGIGFGGYALDEYDKAKNRRCGVGMSIDFLQEIMDVVGVRKWEDLKGKYVRLDTEGWGGKALGIGNLLEEKWLYPQQWFIEHEAEAKK